MMMTRKQFLRSILGAGAGAIGVAAIAACGDDGGGSSDAAGKNCLTNGTNASIGTNHGHTLTVSVADVTAGAEKTYDITGTSAHAHMVTISAAQFTMLKANTSIMVTSTSDGTHTHTVSVTCL